MITNRDIKWVRTDELYHHGIKGQKWGVRRYQNADGTLTSAGKAHKNGFIILKSDGKSKVQQRKEKSPEAEAKRVESNKKTRSDYILEFDVTSQIYANSRDLSATEHRNAKTQSDRIRYAFEHYAYEDTRKVAEDCMKRTMKLDPSDKQFDRNIRSVNAMYDGTYHPPTKKDWEKNLDDIYGRTREKPPANIKEECSYENFCKYMNEQDKYSPYNPANSETKGSSRVKRSRR